MPTPDVALALEQLDTHQLESLLVELGCVPTGMRARGRQYVAAGRVGPPRITNKTLSAFVRGTRRYATVWSWNGGQWRGTCDCPVSYRCKHLFALGSAVLESWPDSEYLTRQAQSLIARGPVRWAALPALATTGSGASSVSEPPKHAVVAYMPRESGGRAAPPAAPDHQRIRAQGFAQLREGQSFYERQRGFHMLLSRPGVHSTPPHSAALMRALEDDDPDVRCLRVARLFPALADGWLPPELAPFLSREDLLERERQCGRDALADELRAWARGRSVAPNRSLRFVLGLKPDPERVVVLSLEPRVTTAKLRDDVRSESQLQQLLREGRGRPDVLEPRTLAMLEGYLSGLLDGSYNDWMGRRGFTTNMLRRLLELGGGTPGLVWDPLLAPELSARHGITPGAPVGLGAGGACIAPVCTEAGEDLAIGLQVCWPDGSTLPMADALLISGEREGMSRHADLLLVRGAIHVLADAPSSALVERFRAIGPVPVRRGDSPELVNTLTRAFPALERSLAPFTRVLQAEVVFVLSLDTGDALRIRMFAATKGAGWTPPHAPAGGIWVDEFDPARGWLGYAAGEASGAGSGFDAAIHAVSTGTTPAREPALPVEISLPSPGASGAAAPVSGAVVGTDVPAPQRKPWFQRVDDSTIAPAHDWLDRAGARAEAALGPSARAARPGFVVPLRGAGLTRFADALAARPTGVRWFATKDVRGMIEDPVIARPRVSVQASGVDLLAVSAEWEAEGRTLTEADFALLRRSDDTLVRLSSGWARRAPSPELDEVESALADLGLEPGAGPQRLTLWQLAHADSDSLRVLESLGTDPALLAAVSRLRAAVAAFKGIPSAVVPPGFTGALRPYQQHGVDFLAWTAALGLGAVLADDMGLGKTVQTLGWLLWLKQRSPRMAPALVVCPTSVIHNWRREAARFAPGLRVAVFERGVERHKLFAAAKRHDLLITNFALLRLDIERWCELKLGAVIIDEAQNIKNPDAAISKAVCSLRAPQRLALTGTPLENRALDLWSIMEFMNPGLLGTRQRFSAAYDRADAPAHRRRLLAAKLRPVLLRRLKQEVARDLPDRIEERLDCELQPVQKRLYLAELSQARDMVAELAAAPGGLKKHGIEILAALTRLRQICCHPTLVGAPAKAGSGKFEAFWELLDPMLAEGRKVLVFSQFVRCLELLAADMKRRKIRHYMLTGATQKRDELVARFQADPEPCTFLISLKAGGTGLNLTAARDVVLFDPWWNPAVEAQAIDRTHRIGQDRTVIAYRLITRGTLEERILELQARKGALAREILGEGSLGRSITREDLDYLLTPE